MTTASHPKPEPLYLSTCPDPTTLDLSLQTDSIADNYSPTTGSQRERDRERERQRESTESRDKGCAKGRAGCAALSWSPKSRRAPDLSTFAAAETSKKDVEFFVALSLAHLAQNKELRVRLVCCHCLCVFSACVFSALVCFQRLCVLSVVVCVVSACVGSASAQAE